MTTLHRLLALLLLMFAAMSCERTTNNYYYYGDYYGNDNQTGGSGGGSSSTGDGGGTSDSGDSDDDDTSDGDDSSDDDDDNYNDGTTYGDEEDDYMSGTVVEGVLNVATALKQNYGSKVNVEGYVVGASASSVSKTVFEAPFPSSANIVLADRQYDGEPIPIEELIQVRLTDKTSTTLRQQYNLKDHPEQHNRKVQIAGVVEKYYSRTAIRYVWNVQLLD